ncbi:beta-mannosidase [Winogradskyella sp. F6397]|uniref:Beta-mannosidase n=1 Tax=Winogradskyella marina TaxID=2785530 RepID=A0ABS0EDS1_9FLAO|nr:glycosyl hydrolase [Winogradskyella marina]MBF8148579.1 beta-mannosidase [Winogradskyella marina]
MKKRLLISAFIGVFIFGCSKDDPEFETDIIVSISASIGFASEPDNHGEFTISLSEPSRTDTTIDYTVSGTATNGVDYQTITNTITVPANSISNTIAITVIDDTIQEGDETVIITLNTTSNPNTTIGSSNSATVTISELPEDFILSPEDAYLYMVNPNATPETIALFYNLKALSKTNFVVGQHDAFHSFYNDNEGESDMMKTTGSDPGLLGSDFMFITDDNNDGTTSNWYQQQEQIITSNAIEAYNKGMINTFCWHMREPYEGDYFYASEMTEFQRNNALVSILPDGANHDYYKQKLQKIAEVANSMVGNDGNLVPFIFRPFHEFDGDWFWWGKAYCSPQQFKELWQFTVTYLRDTLQVNNILFAFSPDSSFFSAAEYLNRYPGDAYVDILGMDNYTDFNNQGQAALESANEKLQIITELAKDRVKIAALTESAYIVTPGENNPISGFYANHMYNALSNNNVEIGYMMFWSNTTNTYCTPPPGQPSTADFLEFVDKPRSILQNELPTMYTLPQ